MKNLKKIIIGASLITALSVHAFTGAALFNYQQNNQNEIVVEAAGPGNYYDSITDSMSGTTLLNALNSLNNKKRKKTVGYAAFRQFAAKCDANPDGGGKIVGFYDNKLIGPSWDGGSTWNREHVWPNVRNGDLVEDDAHMVRPASVSTNSDRGSKGFGVESYDPGKYVNYYRGAAARIIFYAAIADTSLKVVDFAFNYDGVQNGNHGYPVGSMGCLSDMLRWNLEYLPSDTSFTGANDLARRTELNRNEVIQNDSSGQGNRNPFIDHPEYACKIWGNTNDATRAVCGMSSDAPTSITLNTNSAPVIVGKTIQLNVVLVTPSNANHSVTWTSDNKAVATVDSNGLVTGISKGVAVITVSSTINTTIKATCEITVYNEDEGQETSFEPISESTSSNEGGGNTPYSGLPTWAVIAIIAGAAVIVVAAVIVTIIIVRKRKKA